MSNTLQIQSNLIRQKEGILYQLQLPKIRKQYVKYLECLMARRQRMIHSNRKLSASVSFASCDVIIKQGIQILGCGVATGTCSNAEEGNQHILHTARCIHLYGSFQEVVLMRVRCYNAKQITYLS